jgi:hypothetical protein
MNGQEISYKLANIVVWVQMFYPAYRIIKQLDHCRRIDDRFKLALGDPKILEYLLGPVIAIAGISPRFSKNLLMRRTQVSD